MAFVTSIARGIGKTAGWTAATLVKAGESALDQLGESGEVMADAYETSYDTRSAYLDMTPEQRKEKRAAQIAAKREALAAKAPAPAAAPAKKLVKA